MTESVLLGWMCPRCRRVWAPIVTFCDCQSIDEEHYFDDRTVTSRPSSYPAWVETRTG